MFMRKVRAETLFMNTLEVTKPATISRIFTDSNRSVFLLAPNLGLIASSFMMQKWADYLDMLKEVRVELAAKAFAFTATAARDRGVS